MFDDDVENPRLHLPVQDVAGLPSLAEGVNANRYCGST